MANDKAKPTIWLSHAAPQPELELTEDEVAYLGAILWIEEPPKTDKPFTLAGAVLDAIKRQERKGTLHQSITDFVETNGAITKNSKPSAIIDIEQKLQDIKKFGVDIVAKKDETIYQHLNDEAPSYWMYIGRQRIEAVRNSYKAA